jgi:hypothetical protein
MEDLLGAEGRGGTASGVEKDSPEKDKDKAEVEAILSAFKALED